MHFPLLIFPSSTTHARTGNANALLNGHSLPAYSGGPELLLLLLVGRLPSLPPDARVCVCTRAPVRTFARAHKSPFQLERMRCDYAPYAPHAKHTPGCGRTRHETATRHRRRRRCCAVRGAVAKTRFIEPAAIGGNLSERTPQPAGAPQHLRAGWAGPCGVNRIMTL